MPKTKNPEIVGAEDINALRGERTTPRGIKGIIKSATLKRTP